MAIAGPTYLFDYFDIGGFGRQSDGGTWAATEIGKALREDKLILPELKALSGWEPNNKLPHVFVADAAFPMSFNLMRPYPVNGRGGLTPERRVYNYRQSRARRIVENAFGILCHRWRILLNPLDMDREQVINTVTACVILHNYLCITQGCSKELKELNRKRAQSDGKWKRLTAVSETLKRKPNRPSDFAVKTRDSFCRYFSSSIGSVRWQEKSAFGADPREIFPGFGDQGGTESQ